MWGKITDLDQFSSVDTKILTPGIILLVGLWHASATVCRVLLVRCGWYCGAFATIHIVAGLSFVTAPKLQ